MFNSERDELRKTFFTAWDKHLNQLPVEPIEAQLIAIILDHPEYHLILENPDQYQNKDFSDHNPFLHMSLHLALREQINTNRPEGIQKIYHDLRLQSSNALTIEHHMMDCLAEILWEAQRNGRMPGEEEYLNKLKDIKL